jgi:hypothetical protein
MHYVVNGNFVPCPAASLAQQANFDSYAPYCGCKMHLPDDFRDSFRFLNEAGAANMLIGGWAPDFHGYRRATADLDVWVPLNVRNSDGGQDRLSARRRSW